MRTPLTGLVAALAACLALGEAPARAQTYWAPSGYYGGATPASAYAHGAAAMARAAGQYNLLSAQGRIARAEARRIELENKLRATEVYFQMRLLNRAYRAKLRGPRATPEDMKRYADARRPARLSPSELNMITGEITWPILLRDERYGDYRARLEGLFAERAGPEGLSTSSYLEIHRTTRAFLDALQKRVACVPQMDYIAAKRFIQSLAYEARQGAS